MRDTADLEDRLRKFVEHHVLTGAALSVESLTGDRPELAPRVRALIDRYLALTSTIDGNRAPAPPVTPDGPLPQFDGFQSIERIGGGGMGEVYKLRDLRLNRIVAAKVMRRPSGGRAAEDASAFLREARALALFSDRRIVQIFEVRPDADPPVIIMEFVEGFELGRLGPSLDFPQRARVMAEICDAVHHANGLGLTHRDLKPSNVMLDAQLTPRILDFGLSDGDPQSGHLKGTPPYIAPEQLDPGRPIDARTDVYGLGAILYELACGIPPYDALDGTVRLAAIRSGQPRLPIEIDPRVPEPLQAIALAAMEVDPGRRYQTAAEMAADLRRFLEGRTVLARPSIYASTLTTRTRPHLTEIQEWLRLRLIYPHEAERLREAYGALEKREDDWIVESRTLSYPQIALYLGAFLLLCGSLFYFVAARGFDAVSGLAAPFLVLGVPFIGLNAAAHWLYGREHKAVAVAFYLGAVALLPLFLLIAFYETDLLVMPEGTPGQLFDEVSNHQLQITTASAALWCGWLSLRTKTIALSTVFNALVLLLTLAILADFGLRDWVEEQRWDALALHLAPLVAAYAAIGGAAEATDRNWLSRPAYTGSAVMLVLVLELLALNGKAFERIGFSLKALQPAGVGDPLLLDTIAAMTINGVAFYVVAAALDRRRSDPARGASRLLFAIAPFAIIQPVGWLIKTGEYSRRLDWAYAAAALTVMLLSHRRQRRSFYYAGVLNLGIALYFIADHYEWFGRPAWSKTLIAAGLAGLAAGLLLDRRERRLRGL